MMVLKAFKALTSTFPAEGVTFRSPEICLRFSRNLGVWVWVGVLV